MMVKLMNLFESKKAVEMRSSASMVVLIIGVFIIAYLTIMSPSEREQVLNGGEIPNGYSGQGYDGVGVSGGRGTLLMTKFVGDLKIKGSETVEHDIPSSTIFTAVNTKELQKIDNLYVKNSPFSKQERTINFNADLVNTKNYMLSFNVIRASGMINIFLNGQLIFSKEITSNSPEPIILPPELIKTTNNITFLPEPIGWQFWKANEYELSNIIVAGDVTDYSSSRSEQSFAVPADEYENLETTSLEFVPECDPSTSGRILIMLNRQSVYSGLVDCGVLNKQEISTSMLSPGTNVISFSSKQGSYLIDRIKLVSHLNQKDYPTYYFNLPQDMFAQTSTFNGRVVMTIRFNDMTSLKSGSVVVNGFQDTFQTQDYYFQATLDPNILQPGPNSINIEPMSEDLHIAELRVELLG